MLVLTNVFIFPKDEGCLRVTMCRCTKSTLSGRILTSPRPRWIGAGVHSSSLLTVLFLTGSVLWLFSCPHTFSCLLLSVLQQVKVKCYLSGIQCIPSLCPTLGLSLCLSLSLYRSLYLDGACLLCFISLSSIFQRHSHTFITKLHLIKDDLPRLFLAH